MDMLADYRHDLQCSALPVPCSHRFIFWVFLVVFWVLSLGVVLGVVLLALETQNGPSLGRFWSHAGQFWDHHGAREGTFGDSSWGLKHA